MNLELIETIDLPSYAVCPIEYGDVSGLEDTDAENITEFLKGYSDYEYLTFEYGSEEYFSSSPEFGLPCNCLETKVFGVKK